jgi:hypothetical protein
MWERQCEIQDILYQSSGMAVLNENPVINKNGIPLDGAWNISVNTLWIGEHPCDYVHHCLFVIPQKMPFLAAL